MQELLTVNYQQTGKSTRSNDMGMREMQARAYDARDSQYLLIKAPPASGKSRALMFIALDKLHHQGIKKVVVAVPEMSIGASFRNTKLKEHGFFADWVVADKYNLCVPGQEAGKVARFKEFLAQADACVLVCTHATLRYAYQQLEPAAFNDTLLAIDEFHHASADEENKLGELIDGVMHGSNAHIVAMTGSYFRGDAIPILLPEDERLFTQVTYTYYEQLNGYTYLKSLGIGYHFYTGKYLSAIHEVLDTDKKTIIHIPHVASMESTKDKYSEVDAILDVIGEHPTKDSETGIITVTRRSDGKKLKVADLVSDDASRVDVQNYLRHINHADDMDIIIALGMAKEGFDWPWCEHVLTVGYRSSLTEVVQIIGRATRDSEGKTHAQFTNLIAQPMAEDEDVKTAVNNMLKAITVSLLMEQVLAPSITFRPRMTEQTGEIFLLDDENVQGSDVTVLGVGIQDPSEDMLRCLENMDDIVSTLYQKPEVVGGAMVNEITPQLLREVEIPKVIQELFPEMDDEEVQAASNAVFTRLAIETVVQGASSENDTPGDTAVLRPLGGISSTDLDEELHDRRLLKLGGKFIDIENLNMDLIREVNPFQGAYEILSKAVTPEVLKTIHTTVVGMRSNMTEEEAVLLWEHINEFVGSNDKEPSLVSTDPYERRLAEALAYIKQKARERKAAAMQPEQKSE